MQEDYLKDIYNDFFGQKTTLRESNEEIKDIDIDFETEINKLYLNEESKELLKKIVSYIYNYNSDKRYIPFNITILSKTQNTVDKIIDILKHASNKSKYLKTNKSIILPCFSLNDELINKTYKENDLIVLNDLEGIELESIADKQKYMHTLEECIKTNKNISILVCKNDTELNNIFTYNKDLKDKYFVFNLIEEKQEKSVLYSEILESTTLDEENKIKLLDYITATYDKTDLDSETYRDNLINYILINNSIPIIKEEKTTEEIFKDLNELVGLSKVKKSLYDLVDLMKLKEKTDGDLKIGSVNLHMIFLGNPGTGKTTIARLLCGILYNLGYIKENKLIEVTSKDLIAEYVGQTAIKTAEVINKAKGGVLFIDEAYMLGDKNNSYNDDAVGTLIAEMENNRDNLVCIFAGYTKEMQSFLNANSGVTSRIGYTLEFDDYTTEELILIFEGMVKKAGFVLTDEAKKVLEKIIEENKNKENFGNARFVRNVYEKTIIKHASNTKDKKKKSILKTITDKDISTENLI